MYRGQYDRIFNMKNYIHNWLKGIAHLCNSFLTASFSILYFLSLSPSSMCQCALLTSIHRVHFNRVQVLAPDIRL